MLALLEFNISCDRVHLTHVHNFLFVQSNNIVQVEDWTLNPELDLSDIDTQLRRQSVLIFKSKSVTSYTEIRVNSPKISITIKMRDHTEGKCLVTLSI